jgi:hypothetical protein
LPSRYERSLWARAEEAATRQLMLDTITTVASIATLRVMMCRSDGRAVATSDQDSLSSSISSILVEDEEEEEEASPNCATPPPPQAPVLYLSSTSSQSENVVRINIYVVEDGCTDEEGNYTGSFPMHGNVFGRLASMRFTLYALPLQLLRELSIEASTVERLESLGPQQAGHISTKPSDSSSDPATIETPLSGEEILGGVAGVYIGAGRSKWGVQFIPQSVAPQLLALSTTGAFSSGSGADPTISPPSVGRGAVLPFSFEVEDLREDF